MQPNDIVRETPDHRIGYEPMSISVSALKADELDQLGYRTLYKIPHKITAYFHRPMINGVYKSTCFTDPLDNYYLIVATDFTVFHIVY